MIRRSVPCFVDATTSRVAGISGHGMFSFPLKTSYPIFEVEFFASLYDIYSHLAYSNKVCLIGDNTGVLYCLRKGSSRNFNSNCFLQNLPDLWLKHPFYLQLWYIPSSSNPVDFFARNLDYSPLFSISSRIHPLVCAGFATIWPCRIIWNLSVFANCTIALGDHLVRWGQVLAFGQSILGDSSHFVRGGGNFVQLFLICF